jgi:hypothetical protein
MCYDTDWLLDGGGHPIRWTRAMPGELLCPQHIMAIRRAKLQVDYPSSARLLGWP